MPQKHVVCFCPSRVGKQVFFVGRSCRSHRAFFLWAGGLPHFRPVLTGHKLLRDTREHDDKAMKFWYHFSGTPWQELMQRTISAQPSKGTHLLKWETWPKQCQSKRYVARQLWTILPDHVLPSLLSSLPRSFSSFVHFILHHWILKIDETWWYESWFHINPTRHSRTAAAGGTKGSKPLILHRRISKDKLWKSSASPRGCAVTSRITWSLWAELVPHLGRVNVLKWIAKEHSWSVT